MKSHPQFKKSIIVFCSILLIIFLYLALNKKDTSDTNTNTSGTSSTSSKSTPSIIVYSRLENKLLKYDTSSETFVFYNNQENSFQYEFPHEESEIITSGNSLTNDFSIQKKSYSKIKDLKTIPNNESLIPLDIYENNYYFIHYFYDTSGNEQSRKIAIWDEDSNTLSDLDILVDKIVNGVILDDTLYFISYDDKEDYYNLFKTSIKESSDKTLLKSNLNTDTLFKFNDDILFINNDNKIENIENQEITSIPLGTKNYIRGNYFITLDDYSDNLGISIKAYDLLTSNLVIQEDDAIDFVFSDNNLQIINKNNLLKVIENN